MDLADPAGTLQFGMSPILDIEDEESEAAQHGLLFLVCYDEDGLYLDSCLDVSFALGKTWVGVLAAEKLTGVQNQEARSLAAAMTTLSLRARFVSTGSPGPYLVKTSFPLSRDDLEKYLRSMDKSALKSFLKKAKI